MGILQLGFAQAAGAAAGPMSAMGPALAATAGPAGPVAQVPIHLELLRWDPAVEIRVGQSFDLLGHGLQLAVVPAATIQTGAVVEGGARAPFRFKTALSFAVVSKPGRRPEPLTIPGPSSVPAQKGEPPLLGPSAAFVFWDPAASSSGWAYVRIRCVTGKSVTVELAEVSGSAAALTRDPVGLQVDGLSELSWTTFRAQASPSPSYRVERRALGQGEPWEVVAQAVGAGADGVYRWRDAAADLTPARVFEYRVHDSAATDSLGGYLVSHAFGDTPVSVGPGARINLISGRGVDVDRAAHVEVGRSSAGTLVLRPLEQVRFRAVGMSKGVNAKAALGQRMSRSWQVADPTDPSWLPAKSVGLRDGGEIEFLLASGVRGRLSVSERGAQSWSVRRALAVDGSGLLPRAPAVAPLADALEPEGEGEATRMLLKWSLPSESCGVRFEDLVMKVEQEIPLGSRAWRSVAQSAPGAESALLSGLFDAVDGRPAPPVARLRLRHAVVHGPLSAPGEAFDVLRAGSHKLRRGESLEWALARIAAVDFQERIEARAVMNALGEDARAALEALAQQELATPRGLAATEVLRALDESGGGVRLAMDLRREALDALRGRGALGLTPEVLASSEKLDAWLGELPDGLDSATVDGRAHALFLAVDRAERGVASPAGVGTVGDDVIRMVAWLEATAFVDPDEGLRWMARFLLEVGLRPSMASFEPEAPAWLLAPMDQLEGEPLDFRWGEQPATAEELRWFLESRPELSDLRLGPPLARLHAALGEGRWESPHSLDGGPAPASDAVPGGSPAAAPTFWRDGAFYDYDARTAELVLRLVERVRSAGSSIGPKDDEALLRAAEALLSGERLGLLAARYISDRRLASPSGAAPPGRHVVELTGQDLATLQTALLELPEGPGHSAGVDIVLSGGDWSWGGPSKSPERSSAKNAGAKSASGQVRPSYMELRRSHLRILGAGGARPRLLTGLRVTGRNVVLDGVEVESGAGQALTILENGHLVALGCDLRGVGSVLHLQRGTAELYECRVLPAESGGTVATAARLLLPSRLTARATLFAAGSLFISSGALVELDRCVLNSGERMLVQSQDRGELRVRESLLRGTGSGLFRVSSGLLAGSVVDVPRDPLGRIPQSQQDGGLRVSPGLFRLIQPGQTVPEQMKLPTEPLARDRRANGGRTPR